jgi:hypothetical protein
MRLTALAKNQVDVLETRLKLALLFKVTERRVSQLIEANKAFGPLTSTSALDLIKKETGLKVSQLLEDVEKSAA